jgi:hypothetical protein
MNARAGLRRDGAAQAGREQVEGDATHGEAGAREKLPARELVQVIVTGIHGGLSCG